MSVGKTVMRTVMLPLTDEEIVKKAHRIAELREQTLKLQAERLAEMRRLKGEIERCELEVAKHLAAIKDGREEQDVHCEEQKDFEQNTVRYFFGGKVVEERPMEGDERQLEIENGDEPEEEEERDFAAAPGGELPLNDAQSPRAMV